MTSSLEARDSLEPSELERLGVVPYPVAPRTQKQWPQTTPDQFTVGFLGRIQPKKNLETLIDALAQCGPTVRLRVAGDGPDLGLAVRRAERYGLNRRVDWCGFVSGGEKEEFFAEVDALVMPSEFESFGVAAAEALLAGVPVITTARVGLSELVDEGGGLFTSSASAEALAAAIEAVARRRRSFRILGRAAARSSYRP